MDGSSLLVTANALYKEQTAKRADVVLPSPGDPGWLLGDKGSALGSAVCS